MAEFGTYGKFPFTFGGEPSPQAKTFGALVALEGNLYGVDDPQGDQTLDGAWHQAWAAGLSALDTVAEAACFQAWPDRVTDLISEYERILHITPNLLASDQERREAITLAWVGDIRSAYPELQESLTQLDARITLLNPNHSVARSTYYGQLFSRQDQAGMFAGERTASLYPNFSDDFTIRVLFDVGDGIGGTGLIGVTKQRIRDLLDRVSPAWCDYTVSLHRGFTLGVSLLGESSL